MPYADREVSGMVRLSRLVGGNQSVHGSGRRSGRWEKGRKRVGGSVGVVRFGWLPGGLLVRAVGGERAGRRARGGPEGARPGAVGSLGLAHPLIGEPSLPGQAAGR